MEGGKKKNQRGEIKCGGAEGTGDYLTSAFLNLAPDCGGMSSSTLSCLQLWHELIGEEIENHVGKKINNPKNALPLLLDCNHFIH